MELEEQPFIDRSNSPKQDEPISLKEYLICSCCGKEMCSPITLPCLHSFCMDCLRTNHESQRQREEQVRANKWEEERSKHLGQQSVDSSTNAVASFQDFTIKGLQAEYYSIPCSIAIEEGIVFNRDPLFFCCPLKDCDGTTNIPLGNISRLNDLTVNVVLSNIEHTLSIKQDLPKGNILCGSCGRTAIGVCYNKDCNNHPYCSDCLKFHLQDNKKHKIAYPEPPSTSAITDEDIAWDDLRQCDILCTLDDHERFFRNLYCEDHDEVVCLACTGNGGKHRRCDQVINTGEVYEESLKATGDRLLQVEKLRDYFQAAVKTTEEVKRALEIKVENIKETITDKYTVLEDQLRAHRDNLLKKCNSVHAHKTEELNQHLEILNRVSATFEHCINFTSRFKQTAIPSEFVMLKGQIDERLDELACKYSDYRCESNEDDCIFLDESNTFDATSAIGRVYSTPSVKNFKISAVTDSPVALQPAYFSVVTHDVIGNELLCHTTMPKLCATIRHVDEEDAVEGYVERDKGKYFVMVYPSRSGEHELCIYQPMKAPYDKCYVAGKKFVIDVNA